MNKQDGKLIHKDQLMNLKKRFQKKNPLTARDEDNRMFSFDERIVDIHNIENCNIPVDSDTLALVK